MKSGGALSKPTVPTSLTKANGVRKEMQAERRRKLVEATISAIYLYGFAETTVSRIASIAGVSAGNVHHYFGGKDALLEEAMRLQLDLVRTATIARLAKATTPMERLRAIIESNFTPEVFNQEVCVAWLHFMAHATHDERLGRLSRINDRRLRSNLVVNIKPLVGREAAASIAESLASMIDGIWMHSALSSPADNAAWSVLDYLDLLVERAKSKHP